jgi:hypothetical protein
MGEDLRQYVDLDQVGWEIFWLVAFVVAVAAVFGLVKLRGKK